MSVQNQIDRINQNVANTYAVLGALGADMPAEQNSDNLAAAAGTAKAVLYSEQTLTDDQKAQARANIGADRSFDPTVYNLPVLYLTGDISSMTKENAVTLTYTYGDRSGTCTLKWQGQSSLAWAKKNLTIKFDTAFEAASGWGAQTKYCLKANFIDHSHCRNVVSAKLWGRIVKSRATVPTELSGLVNGGAVDGFPIVIMHNGAFYGLYTFNIPKDAWLMGMGSGEREAIIGTEENALDTTFKGETLLDTEGMELEYSSDGQSEWVKNSINACINACINSWGGDLDTVVAQHLDLDSVIDYLIFIVTIKGEDMRHNNYLLVTHDGTLWRFSAYDMDTTYGLAWDGTYLSRAVSNVSFDECADIHRAFELVKRYKTDALRARYAELRKDVLSETRICQLFENFAWAIPSPVYLEDVKRWSTVPGSAVNGVDQIARFVRQRLEVVDKWVDALPPQEIPEEPGESYVNLVPTAIDTDGSIYNGGLGYKAGYRVSSSGSIKEEQSADAVCTGYMTARSADTIRIAGITWATNTSGNACAIALYNASFEWLGTLVKGSSNAYYGICTTSSISVSTEDSVSVIDLPVNSNIAYCVISGTGSGADMIVTRNQAIAD